MTTGSGLQLFPAPQKKPQKPDLSAAVQAALANNPKKTVKSPVDLTEVVIHVTPAANTLPPPPPRRQTHSTVPNGSTWNGDSKSKDLQAPAQQSRGPSPVPSEYLSVRSVTPSLVRSNTNATSQTAWTGPHLAMQSIFPQYNPNLSLSQQPYLPTQTSPPGIPRDKISKAPYSPEFSPPQGMYIPHANVRDSQTQNTDPSSPTPSHTPLEQLQLAWDVMNGRETSAAPASITLPLHRTISSPNPAKSPADRTKTEMVFGPSREESFYTFTQSAIPSFLQGADSSPRDQELTLLRHHPSQTTSIPVVDLTMRPPPSRQQSPLSGQSDVDYMPHLVTTIFPKLAAMSAIEAAANSPAAMELARVDPNATSPAAQQLAHDAVADAASRECCALFWIPPASPDTPRAWGQSVTQGSYELHHPTLGTFPIAVAGNVSRHFSCTSEPTIRPTTSDTRNFSRPNPGSSSIRTSSAVTSAVASVAILDHSHQMTNATRYTGPSTLARLDLSANSSATCNALTLDLPAVRKLGNAFLADALAAAILAVAAAEVERGCGRPDTACVDGLSGDLSSLLDQAMVFPAPPTPHMQPARKPKSSKTSTKSSSSSSASDKNRDRDISRWKTRFGKKSKQVIELAEMQGQTAIDDIRGDDGKLALPMRVIVGTIKFTFKTAVFVVEIGFKVVGGVVVGIIRRVDRV